MQPLLTIDNSKYRTSGQTLLGTETVVHGLHTYVSSNNPMAIIVVVRNIFCWRLANTRLIADQICEKTGGTFYVPDFMNSLFQIL